MDDKQGIVRGNWVFSIMNIPEDFFGVSSLATAVSEHSTS